MTKGKWTISKLRASERVELVKKLKDIQTKHDLTAKQIVELVGRSVTTHAISTWVNEICLPQGDRAVALHDFFKQSDSEIDRKIKALPQRPERKKYKRRSKDGNVEVVVNLLRQILEGQDRILEAVSKKKENVESKPVDAPYYEPYSGRNELEQVIGA